VNLARDSFLLDYTITKIRGKTLKSPPGRSQSEDGGNAFFHGCGRKERRVAAPDREKDGIVCLSTGKTDFLRRGQAVIQRWIGGWLAAAERANDLVKHFPIYPWRRRRERRRVELYASPLTRAAGMSN